MTTAQACKMCNYLVQTYTDVDQGRMLPHFGKSLFCEFIGVYWDSCKYAGGQ